MCAIAGIIAYNEKIDVQSLHQMSKQMVLRGPDESGYYVDSHVGFGHCRLAVIDVNNGHQPMSIDNEDFVIVYNGETYNFLEIKSELQKKGAVFKTQSDTEVILYAYKYWGIRGCLERMDGMFAFAIYDKTQQKVFLVRDRFGEKPLFYQLDKQGLAFASELKAFLPHLGKYEIDKTALNLFLTLNYIPAPYTIYKDIHKLRAGHYLEIDLKAKEVTDYQYDDVKNVVGQIQEDKSKAIRTLKELLTDSVRKRMVSDVPMGAFLSGGIDSSIICCLMSRMSKEPIHTFSIGFKEKEYDESERAQLVARHIMSNHTQYTLDYSDVLSILDDIILYYDEPFGDSSAVPSYYVGKLASEKVKVVLTGDCADELFGGYEKYLADYYVKRYQRVPKTFRLIFERLVEACPVTSRTNHLLRKIKKVISNSHYSGFDLYYHMMCQGFDDQSRKMLMKDIYYKDIKQSYKQMWDEMPENASYLQKEQLMDIMGGLEGDMFPKVDRACMHHSLENRAPFIDRRIVSFAMNLSDELKIKGKNKKYLLKEAFKEILPKKTVGYPKSGFGVPVDYWFCHELKDELKKLLTKDFIEQQGIFDYTFISQILNEHLKGRENYKNQLWNLFVFQRWYTKIYQCSE